MVCNDRKCVAHETMKIFKIKGTGEQTGDISTGAGNPLLPF